MKRDIYLNLMAWKTRNERKPLILKGARQVGKTFVVMQFGKEQFAEVFKLDFLRDTSLCEMFASLKDLSPATILQQLEFYFKKTIDVKNHLLFFDEIQECPEAISSLKFFSENMPELAIISAGSYLGIMTNEDSFPVGKVEYLSMVPCTFKEYLEASDPKLYKIFNELNLEEHDPIPHLFHEALLKEWQTYLALGGMPEVIKVYFNKIKEGKLVALNEARKIQLQLLEGYKSDFSKHSGKVNANHILHVFESIPQQLSKSFDESVSRYHFTGVIPKKKGFDPIRGPLTWLTKSRLLLKSFIANKAEHPLMGFSEENKFKLYFFDVGLLQASLQVPMEAIASNQVGSYKGYIVENFVAQELFGQLDSQLFSWNEGTAEIEFIITCGQNIIPLEVKSSAKSRRARSLDSFIERYSPAVAYKFTAQNRGFDEKRKILTTPIYLMSKLTKNC